jgi:hypothetical protein
MTGASRTSTERRAERGIKATTLAVFVEGLRRKHPDAIANGVLMFAATYLPGVAERRFGVEFRPWQRVYTQITMLAHAIGFLGPYDDTWWWDHVTHALSATLLGGFVHVAARRRGRDPRRDVLASVGGGGLLWEAGEYTVHRVSALLGIDPMLVYYGRRDALEDLLFNLVGALLVLSFGDRLLHNFTQGED